MEFFCTVGQEKVIFPSDRGAGRSAWRRSGDLPHISGNDGPGDAPFQQGDAQQAMVAANVGYTVILVYIRYTGFQPVRKGS